MATTLDELTLQIKDRLDIVDVVSRQVILKKNGGNYWGLCPFHKEKTPSFSVTPSKGIYKCFGCGEGGDSISFIMKTENKEFMDVIKEYAELFHLEMPDNFKKTDRNLKDELIRACSEAAKYYQQNLKGEPLKYLKNRGITQEIIEKFSLGLADTDLHKKFKDKFSTEILEKAGLIVNKDGSYTDRFRNRIMIPIQDENGQTIAFGARALNDDQIPKYLNSPDSLIYNKSKILYGLYSAKEAIKNEDSVILMEGYFDVIAAQSAGVQNCVASCGTSLTQDHIKLLSRYSPSRKIYLSFDTDSAGIKATNRNADLIKESFEGLGNIKQFDESYLSTSQDKYACEIRVIAPPQGKDPDEFIRTMGADAFKQYAATAPLLIDYQFNALLKEKDTLKTPQDKIKFVKKLVPLLKEINNAIIRSEYVKTAAAELNLDENSLLNELRQTKDVNNHNQSNNENRIVNIVTKTSSIEEKAQKNLLSLFLVNNSPVSHDQLSRKLDCMELTDQTLINVKTTLDKITFTVKNTKEIIDQLYTTYAQDPDTHKTITQLIGIAEPFDNLSEKDFLTVVEENLKAIHRCRVAHEHSKLQEQYKNTDIDDAKALEIQKQLRDKLKRRQLND